MAGNIQVFSSEIVQIQMSFFLSFFLPAQDHLIYYQKFVMQFSLKTHLKNGICAHFLQYKVAEAQKQTVISPFDPSVNDPCVSGVDYSFI